MLSRICKGFDNVLLLLITTQIVCFSCTAFAGPCTDGFSDDYPCNKINLLSLVPNSVFSVEQANDVQANDLWGWTDPVSGTEYALLGVTTGVAFLDLSDPENPLYLGLLPTQSINSNWRDIKVFEDHAYIVSEAIFHGMQIFNLNHLSEVISPPVIFTSDALYSAITDAHNIVINEGSGMAYVVGSNTCAGGLHAIDINDKLNPVFAGCYAGDGYTHDAQCVTYIGPDIEHQASEICIALNEDTLTIVDMTNPASPILLSRMDYEGSRFTHQG